MQELDQLIRERTTEPVLGFLYERYKRLGLLETTISIIDLMSFHLQEPVIHTLGSHITKEKPLFVMAFANANGLKPEKAQTLASSTDLLWCLSLMYDDIEDKDELRSGKQSAWVKYGVNTTRESVFAGLKVIWKVIGQEFGEEVAANGNTWVQRGIRSLDTHRYLTFFDPMDQFIENYLEREGFHCTFPVDAIWHDTPASPQKFHALSSIQELNLAGQITNDVKDMIPQYEWLRLGFSDLRNGLVTIPLKIMWDMLSRDSQKDFLLLVKKKEYTDEEKHFLESSLKQSGAMVDIRAMIQMLYASSRKHFYEVVTNKEDREVVDLWVRYKENQLRGFYGE